MEHVRKLTSRLSDNRNLISTAKQEVANFDLDFTGPTISVDRTDGLEVKGKIGKKVTSKDDLDSQLDAIEDFNF